MTWNNEMRQFVAAHLYDDTSRLLLSAHRFPGIDVPFAVEQIESRRRLRTKLPEWFANDDLVMSGRIPAEQCSSEQTARFKRSVMLPDASSLCDMTGGMGVDFWYMSQGLERAIYTERQPSLCEAARHNFQVLQHSADVAESSSDVANPSSDVAKPSPDVAKPSSDVAKFSSEIIVREGLSTELPIPDVDVIYLDPARRSVDGSRIYEISDCEPDVVAWQDDLLQHCRQLIIKVSPMADISRTLSRLHHVSDIYIISVRNECKELLIVQKPSCSQPSYTLHCVDFLSSRTIQFNIGSQELSDAPAPVLAGSLGKYFYEPDVSIMKCQAFGVLSSRFGLNMLDADSHYFTSDELCADFPGRIFCVEEQLVFSSKELKRLRVRIPQANIATRGFAMSADTLRLRAGIRDGGDVYLFGASLHGTGNILVRCKKKNCPSVSGQVLL